MGDDDEGPVAAVRVALRRADKRRLVDLALSVDSDEVELAREVLARAAVTALRDAGYHLPRRPPEPGDRIARDEEHGLTLREHLRQAVSYALGRVPRSWLRRLATERHPDDLRTLVAGAVVDQVERSNIRYALGPPVDAAAQFGARAPARSGGP